MKFSIGIPVYKAIFLRECIDSIMRQTYADFELIMVNDASPDNIDEIVFRYADPRIKYFKNDKNIGAEHVVDNWNRCLSHARGEYFILMGDDDKLSSDYLETFCGLIQKYPLLDVFHCRSLVIDKDSKPVRLTEPRAEFETVYDLILERLRGHRSAFISDHVYRTEALKNKGGFYKLPLAWASDDISAYMAAGDRGIAHTNKPVFIYRESPFTITSRGKISLKMDAMMGEERWLRGFIKADSVDSVEEQLQKNILFEIKRYFEKRKAGLVADAMILEGAFSFFQWVRLRRKYNISVDELWYALFLFLKDRRKSEEKGGRTWC